MDLLTALARHAIGAAPDVVPASRFAATGSGTGFDWELSWSDRQAGRAVVGQRRTAGDAAYPRADQDVVPPDDSADMGIGSCTEPAATGGAVASVAIAEGERADASAPRARGEPLRPITARSTGTPPPAKTEGTVEYDGSGTAHPTDASCAAGGAARGFVGGVKPDRADDHLALEVPLVRAVSRQTSSRRVAAAPGEYLPGAEPSAHEARRLTTAPTTVPTVAVRGLDSPRSSPPETDTVGLRLSHGDDPDAAGRQVQASDERVGEAALVTGDRSRHNVGQDARPLPVPLDDASMHSVEPRHAGFAGTVDLHVPTDRQAEGPLPSSSALSGGRRQRRSSSPPISTLPAGRSPAIDDRAEPDGGVRARPMDRSADHFGRSIAPTKGDVDGADRRYRPAGIDLFPDGGGATWLPDMATSATATRATAPRSAELLSLTAILSPTEPALRAFRKAMPIVAPASGFAPANEASASERDTRTSAGGRYRHRSDVRANVDAASHRHLMAIAAAFRTGGEHYPRARSGGGGTGIVELRLPPAATASLVTHATRRCSNAMGAGRPFAAQAIGQADGDVRSVDLPIDDQKGDAAPANSASPAAHEPMRRAIKAIGGQRPAGVRVHGHRDDPATTGDHAVEPDRTSAACDLVAARGSRASSAAENDTEFTTAYLSRAGETVSVPAFVAVPSVSVGPVAADRRVVGDRSVGDMVTARSDVWRIDDGDTWIDRDPLRPSLARVARDVPSRDRTATTDAPAGERREGADPTVLSTAIPLTVSPGGTNARAGAQAATRSSSNGSRVPLPAYGPDATVHPEQADGDRREVSASPAAAARTTVAPVRGAALPALDAHNRERISSSPDGRVDRRVVSAAPPGDPLTTRPVGGAASGQPSAGDRGPVVPRARTDAHSRAAALHGNGGRRAEGTTDPTGKAIEASPAGPGVTEHRSLAPPRQARAAVPHEALPTARSTSGRRNREQATETISALVERVSRDDRAPAVDRRTDIDVPALPVDRAAGRRADGTGPAGGAPDPRSRAPASDTRDREGQVLVDVDNALSAKRAQARRGVPSASASSAHLDFATPGRRFERGTAPASPHRDAHDAHDAHDGSAGPNASEAAATSARVSLRASADGETRRSPREPTRPSGTNAVYAPLVDDRQDEATLLTRRVSGHFDPTGRDPLRITLRPAAATPSPRKGALVAVETPSVRIDTLHRPGPVISGSICPLRVDDRLNEALSDRRRVADRRDPVRVDGAPVSLHRATRTDDHGRIAPSRLASGFLPAGRVAAASATAQPVGGEDAHWRHAAARSSIGSTAADPLLTRFGQTAWPGGGRATALADVADAAVVGLAARPADGVERRCGPALSVAGSIATERSQPGDAGSRLRPGGGDGPDQLQAMARSRSGKAARPPRRTEERRFERDLRAPVISARASGAPIGGGDVDPVRPVQATNARPLGAAAGMVRRPLDEGHEQKACLADGRGAVRSERHPSVAAGGTPPGIVESSHRRELFGGSRHGAVSRGRAATVGSSETGDPGDAARANIREAAVPPPGLVTQARASDYRAMAPSALARFLGGEEETASNEVGPTALGNARNSHRTPASDGSLAGVATAPDALVAMRASEAAQSGDRLASSSDEEESSIQAVQNLALRPSTPRSSARQIAAPRPPLPSSPSQPIIAGTDAIVDPECTASSSIADPARSSARQTAALHPPVPPSPSQPIVAATGATVDPDRMASSSIVDSAQFSARQITTLHPPVPPLPSHLIVAATRATVDPERMASSSIADSARPSPRQIAAPRPLVPLSPSQPIIAGTVSTVHPERTASSSIADSARPSARQIAALHPPVPPPPCQPIVAGRVKPVKPERTASSSIVDPAQVIVDRSRRAGTAPGSCREVAGDGDAPTLGPGATVSPRANSPQRATTVPTATQVPGLALAPGDRSGVTAPEAEGVITSTTDRRNPAGPIERLAAPVDASGPVMRREPTRQPSHREPTDTRPTSAPALAWAPAPIAALAHADPAGRSVDAPIGARRRVMRVQTGAVPVLHVGRIRIAPAAIAARSRVAPTVRAAPTLGLSAYLERRR